MITLKTRTDSPKTLAKQVSAKISNIGDKANFDTMVRQSVNLGAKNTKNFNSKDLAMLQLCHLAEMYGVTVERT